MTEPRLAGNSQADASRRFHSRGRHAQPVQRPAPASDRAGAEPRDIGETKGQTRIVLGRFFRQPLAVFGLASLQFSVSALSSWAISGSTTTQR